MLPLVRGGGGSGAACQGRGGVLPLVKGWGKWCHLSMGEVLHLVEGEVLPLVKGGGGEWCCLSKGGSGVTCKGGGGGVLPFLEGGEWCSL